MAFHPIYTLLVLVVTSSVLLRLLRYFRDPEQRLPGPLAARFSKLWYFRHLYAGNFHETNLALHRNHGKIVRLAPNTYSIDDPGATKTLYGPGTRFIKADWYSVWGPPSILEWNLFALQDPKQHAGLRRKYANFYSMSTLVEYEDYIDEVVDVFCHKLDDFAADRSVINFGHWLQCYAFDVIAKITFGERFGFLNAGDDVGNIMKSLEQFGLYSTLMGVYPWIYRLISRLEFKQSSDYIIDYTSSKFAARQRAIEQGKPLPETPDFCTKFFLAHEKSPETFSPLHVLAGAGANISAGSETTSIALVSILYHLISHPKKLEQLRDELEAAEATGGISRPITFAQSQLLEYFQAVVKEAMRLHPSAALPFWRIVPPEGATIAGQFFQAGSVVGINPWVAHHNKNIFGQDADYFRPERWLEASPEAAAMMDRYWMPFGLGARTCIGKNISLLEIAKVIPELIRRFEFQIADVDKMENVNHWFVKQKNFKVFVKIRETGRRSDQFYQA